MAVLFIAVSTGPNDDAVGGPVLSPDHTYIYVLASYAASLERSSPWPVLPRTVVSGLIGSRPREEVDRVARVIPANGTVGPSHKLWNPALWNPALVLAFLGAAVLVADILIVMLWKSTTKVTEPGGVITTTDAPFSESVGSTLLGAGVLLVLAGAFFNRVSKITGPGDIAVEFSPDEKDAAAKAVAARVKDNDPEINRMAKSGDPTNPAKANEATRDLAQMASKATLDCLQSARALLKVAQTTPEVALTLADEWQIPPDAATAMIHNGEPSPDLWTALADKAVSRLG
jgi:hypothetical protein